MEHRIKNIKTIKGKFNIVDVIVIALALLLVFTALFIFDPFDWVAPIDRREVAVTYVIEISGVDNELCTGIEEGQTVINDAEIIERGYYQIENKLNSLGAVVERI